MNSENTLFEDVDLKEEDLDEAEKTALYRLKKMVSDVPLKEHIGVASDTESVEEAWGEKDPYVGISKETIEAEEKDYVFLVERAKEESIRLMEAGRAIVGDQKSQYKDGVPHEYDFDLYKRIFLAVPVIYKSILNFANMVTHSGYWISTYDQNETTDQVKFTKKWERFINLRQTLIHTVVDCMIYGNAFFEIVGRTNNSGKYSYNSEWVVTELKRVDPCTMFVQRSANGTVKKYIQVPTFNKQSMDDSKYLTRTFAWVEDQEDGSDMPEYLYEDICNIYNKDIDVEETRQPKIKDVIRFDPKDMLHVKLNPLPGAAYGTSAIEPLRRVLAMILGGQDDLVAALGRHGFPLIHWKVGTEEVPGTEDQVKAASLKLGGRRPDYDLVTAYTISGEMITGSGNMTDYIQYIDRWFQELFAGLGYPMFLLGMGDGVSGEQAKLQWESLKYECISLQEVLGKNFEKIFMIVNKVEEVTPVSIDKIPILRWKPILTEEEKYIRAVALWQGDVIGHIEVRRDSGYPEEIDGKLFSDMVHDRALELAKASAAATAAARPLTGIGGTSKAGPKPTTKQDRSSGANISKPKADGKKPKKS